MGGRRSLKYPTLTQTWSSLGGVPLQLQKFSSIYLLIDTECFVPCRYHQKYLLQRHPWLLQALDIDPEDLVENHVAARLNGYVGGYGKASAFEAEWEGLGLNNKMAEYVKKELIKNKR